MKIKWYLTLFVFFFPILTNAQNEPHLTCRSSETSHAFSISSSGGVALNKKPMKMEISLMGSMGIVVDVIANGEVDYQESSDSKNPCQLKLFYPNGPKGYEIKFSGMKAGNENIAELNYPSSALNAYNPRYQQEHYKKLRCTLSEAFVNRYCPSALSSKTNPSPASPAPNSENANSAQ